MKVFLCRFHKIFGLFNMLIIKRVSKTLFFKEWSNQVFHSLYFPKQNSYYNHLFFQNVENLMQIAEMQQENLNKLLVLKIIAFESGTINSHNPEQDIFHWQSRCYETPLRFNISVREIFPISGSPIVMKKHDESVLIQISQEFWTL